MITYSIIFRAYLL